MHDFTNNKKETNYTLQGTSVTNTRNHHTIKLMQAICMTSEVKTRESSEFTPESAPEANLSP